MSEDKWTTIGLPQSVKTRIEELKPEGQAPYIFIQNLMDNYEADTE